MAVHTVRTYTQNLGVKERKGLDVLLKRPHFRGSATGEIFEIKGEEDIFLAKVIGKPNGTPG
jgi:hypothetical protein